MSAPCSLSIVVQINSNCSHLCMYALLYKSMRVLCRFFKWAVIKLLLNLPPYFVVCISWKPDLIISHLLPLLPYETTLHLMHQWAVIELLLNLLKGEPDLRGSTSLSVRFYKLIQIAVICVRFLRKNLRTFYVVINWTLLNSLKGKTIPGTDHFAANRELIIIKHFKGSQSFMMFNLF